VDHGDGQVSRWLTLEVYKKKCAGFLRAVDARGERLHAECKVEAWLVERRGREGSR
jgi:hypothetical protein